MNSDQKFNIILADPPWSFKTWSNKGKGRSAENHYSTMSTTEICNLPIKDLADRNCALFLWATWPKLPDALEVMEAWGFQYIGLAWIWIKSNPTGFGFFQGMGYYTRANSEPSLLAVRGKMPVASHSILSIIYAPVLSHSRKPDDQYRKIEALYPTSLYPNRLELFARRRWPGYVSMGNQLAGGSDIVLAKAA